MSVAAFALPLSTRRPANRCLAGEEEARVLLIPATDVDSATRSTPARWHPSRDPAGRVDRVGVRPGQSGAAAGRPEPAHTGRIQRRASNTGGICVCSQKIALGREHARKTVTVHVGDDTLTIELDDGHRTIRRTTDTPVYQVKAQRARKITQL